MGVATGGHLGPERWKGGGEPVLQYYPPDVYGAPEGSKRGRLHFLFGDIRLRHLKLLMEVQASRVSLIVSSEKVLHGFAAWQVPHCPYDRLHLFQSHPHWVRHITSRTQWEDAKKSGVYEGDTLATEGFIHCSTTKQVIEVANALFRRRNDLVLLEIDPSRVQPEIRWEGQEDGPLFPHIYGQLDCDAVVEVLPFDPDAEGFFDLPEKLLARRGGKGV